MSGERSFEQILVLPVISEKSYASMAAGRYVFRCHPHATKIQIRRALEEAFVDQKITVHRREHDQRARQEASPLARSDAGARTEPRLEEGNRDSRRRPEDRRPLRRRVSDANQEIQANEPGPPIHVGEQLRGRDQERTAAPVGRAPQEAQRTQRVGSHHRSPPGRRTQEDLSPHRLQASEGRTSRQGEDDRVRPEPQRAHRARGLRGRRQALHPLAARLERRRCRQLRRHRGNPPGMRAAHHEHSSRYDDPQSRGQAGPRRPAGAQRRNGRATARQRGRVCAGAHAQRRGAAHRRALLARRSARSATSTTRTRSSARPASRDGGAFARRFVA